MYCEFFGFSEKPFTITPNPRFVFLSKNHREAFAHLLYGIDNRAGFIELTGEVGTGKTTVLRTLLGQLDENRYRTALILNPCLSAEELLRAINKEYGIPWQGLSIAALLDHLNQFLLEENTAGRIVVLVIDEAQNLDPRVLEQIRLVSNLETERDKLIQIILSGQPELAELLARPELRQIAQRIMVRFHLLPMDFEDTSAYIRHRLEIAGGVAAAVFSSQALKVIYRYAHGYPRLTNIACDRALLAAYAEDDREISGAIASKAIKELNQSRSRVRKFRLKPAAIILTIMLAAVSVAIAFLRYTPPPPKTSTPSAVAQPPLALPFFVSLAQMDERENRLAAFNAVATQWTLRPFHPLPGAVVELKSMARARRLTLTPFNGTLSQLIRHDTPALLQFDLPGGGKRWLALIAKEGNQIRLAPAVAGSDKFTENDLAGIWSGNALIPWNDRTRMVPQTGKAPSQGQIAELQKLLIKAGFLKAPITKQLDAMTLGAIKAFRTKNGLALDGPIDGLTLFLLNKSVDSSFPGLGGKPSGDRP